LRNRKSPPGTLNPKEVSVECEEGGGTVHEVVGTHRCVSGGYLALKRGASGKGEKGQGAEEKTRKASWGGGGRAKRPANKKWRQFKRLRGYLVGEATGRVLY